MKIKIIDSELIEKEDVINELSHCCFELSKEEIDECLDIIYAIDNGEFVYNIKTNHGDYLLFVKPDDTEN